MSPAAGGRNELGVCSLADGPLPLPNVPLSRLQGSQGRRLAPFFTWFGRVCGGLGGAGQSLMG